MAPPSSSPNAPPKAPEPPAPPASGFGPWAWGWIKSIAGALVMWFLLTTFLMGSFRITSGSMEPTLMTGDFLFVTKALYGAELPVVHKRLPGFRGPRLGDLVVFGSPIEDLTIVKRLVAMAGDTIGMVGGRLIRNGQPVAEPYVRTLPDPPMPDAVTLDAMRSWQLRYLVDTVTRADYHPTPHDWGPVVVPNGSLFLMGDNRDESFDGRFYGFVPWENVIGKVFMVYYSFDASSYRSLPALTATRWGRILALPR